MSEDKHAHYKIVVTRISDNLDQVANMIADNYASDINRIRILLKNLPYEIPEKFNSLKSAKIFLNECNKLNCETKVVRLEPDKVEVKKENNKVNKTGKKILSGRNMENSSKIIIGVVILFVSIIGIMLSYFVQDSQEGVLSDVNSNKVNPSKMEKINRLVKEETKTAINNSSSKSVRSNEGLLTKDNTKNQITDSNIRDNNKQGNNTKTTKVNNARSNAIENDNEDNQNLIDLEAMADLLTPAQIEVLSAFNFNQPMSQIIKEVENSHLSRREKIEIANIYQEAAKTDLQKTRKALEISLAFNHNNKKNWQKLISTYEMLGDDRKAENSKEQMYKQFPYLRNKKINKTDFSEQVEIIDSEQIIENEDNLESEELLESKEILQSEAIIE
ncbi:MAG: hypothetical protein HQL46_04215 [Gammaproteobacteria bacterium]|nr:hypothetical protein [Gammaproteobacteria bacterium]